MINLIAYTSPNKEFDKESAVMVKIQIDNSLELGWKKETILLVTNFDYEYQDIKSLVVGNLFCQGDKASNKILVIKTLFDREVIKEKELYWYHDLDAFQDAWFTEEDLQLDCCDLGLTNYGYKIHWQCGCFFFRKEAEDIFRLWSDKLKKRRQGVKKTRADEKILKFLTDHNLVSSRRYCLLDMSYNFQYLYLPRHFYYDKAEKPLKVLHFHPLWTKNTDPRLLDSPLNTFMYGKGKLKFPLMSPRLIKVFNQHGIQ